MTPSRDPDEVEQTLLPGSPAQTPPAPAEASDVADTPPHPAASDATVVAPVSAPPADSGETLPSAASAVSRPAVSPAGHETNDRVEATLLPGTASSTPGTLADAHSAATGVIPGEIDATLPSPVGRTVASGTGPLGSDTAPVSVSVDPGVKLGPSPSATGTMVGRFALRSLHATGGLGEVFTARDTELNREVAVKRIKSRYADDPGSRHRFLTEAQLTARLDHPGVVPVFGLVNDARGRPCYAMRFIRGETLKDEIDRYYGLQKTEDKGEKAESGGQKTEKTDAKSAAEPDSATPPEGACIGVPRTVAFRHLLARFIATCQAIGYAHSRNIIHRDIKPANIMVGTFGETLVVDWGLAKSLDDGPDFDRVMKSQAEAGYRRDPEATDMPSHMTLAGTAVGTPAYMAPEQAAGEIDKVGPRADVYALGATLFAILTGKAPVSGKTTNEVLENVRRGAYEPAAVVNPECPKPLDAIARKAMALNQEDRYATALELAADVERWLSDEPVSCYQDPLLARLARWARRHPARVATAVSLLLAGTIGALGIAWAIHLGEQQTREEQKKTAIERDRAIAAEHDRALERDRVVAQEKLTADQRDRAIAAEKKATALGHVATRRYENAVKAYNTLVYDIDKKMADRAGLQDLRKSLLENATIGLQQLIDGGGEGHVAADRTLVAARRQMGEVYQLLGETAKAREQFVKAVLLATEVVRESLPADKRAANRDLGLSFEKLAGIQLQAGDTKAALDAVDSAIKIFADLAEVKTDAEAQKDLARAKTLRAKIRRERGETGDAMKDCQDALAIRQALSDAAPADLARKRDLAASLDALAGLQLATGNTREATENAKKCLDIREKVAKEFPKQPDVQRELADAHTRLAETYFERGQMTAAAKECSEGLRVLEPLKVQDEKSVSVKADLALLYGRLGHIQLRTGDVEEAVKNTEKGVELAAELQKADPASAQAQRNLALAREQYGDALLAIGRTDDGIKEYAASEQALRPLRTNDKESAQAKIDLARGLERLGDGRMANGDMPGAIAAYTESVGIRKEVRKKDDESASARRDLAMSLYKLAGAYCGDGKPGRADGLATEATDLFVALAKADPESAQAQRDIAQAYGKWGQILANGGHATGALIVWQSSLDRCEKLAKVDDKNVQAKEDEAAAWERLAGFYAALGNTDRALTASRNAVNLWASIGNGTDTRTKAGRRRLALAMLRCGDINTEVRRFNAARDWYKNAAKEVAGDSSDPVLGPVAVLAKQQQEYVNAVEAGLSNPANVRKYDKSVQAAALRTVATLEIRAGHPVSASLVAAELGKEPASAADKFVAAKTFAGCTAATRGTKEARDSYAADAVKYLKAAIKAGFHDTEALNSFEWEAVRKHAPEFETIKAELEKQNAAGK